MSKKSTETSSWRFSSWVAEGSRSSSSFTASGTNFESFQALTRGLELLQGGGELAIARLQVLLRGSQARRHVVEGRAEARQLVARGRARALLEIPLADSMSDLGEVL